MRAIVCHRKYTYEREREREGERERERERKREKAITKSYCKNKSLTRVDTMDLH